MTDISSDSSQMQNLNSLKDRILSPTKPFPSEKNLMEQFIRSVSGPPGGNIVKNNVSNQNDLHGTAHPLPDNDHTRVPDDDNINLNNNNNNESESDAYHHWSPTPICNTKLLAGPARKRRRFEPNETNSGLTIIRNGSSSQRGSNGSASNSTTNTVNGGSTNTASSQMSNVYDHSDTTEVLVPQLARNSGDIGAFVDLVKGLGNTIRTVPIFKNIDEGKAIEIANAMEEKTYQSGEFLFEQGDSDVNDNFYIVVRGEAEILIPHTNESTLDLLHHEHRVIKVGTKCQLTKPTRIGAKIYPAKTMGIVDKFDDKRSYPYTFRVDQDGTRGRVNDQEIVAVSSTSSSLTGGPGKNSKYDYNDMKCIALLRSGDYCGEQAILKQTVRMASVCASTKIKEPLVCAVLSREKFLQLDIHHLVHFPERKAVRAVDLEYEERIKTHITGTNGSTTSSSTVTTDNSSNLNPNQNLAAKSDSEAQWLKECILKNHTLSELITSNTHLADSEHLDAMVAVAYRKKFNMNDVVMTMGDMFATEFYVIEDGKFEVEMDENIGNLNQSESDNNDQAQGQSEQDLIDQHHLIKSIQQKGGSFGELALVHMSPRQATVKCVSQGGGSTWVIDRLAFKSVLYYSRKEKMKSIVNLINEISVFNCLLHDERELLAETLYEKHYLKNEFIMKKGLPCNMFFIVRNGIVNVDGTLIDCHIKSNRGIYFGEDSLLQGCSGTHTVVAHSDDVDILYLSKQDFEHILGPLADMILHHDEKIQNQKGSTDQDATMITTLNDPRIARKKTLEIPMVKPGHKSEEIPVDLGLGNLQRIGVLGIGGFGYVTLEAYKEKTYALKKISKAYIIKSRMTKMILNEKQIHFMCNSDFIIRLYATFKDPTSLYLLLETALGGELYHTYNKNKFHGSGTKARFYVATALIALDHLHKKKVLYRDLKPENLLLDHNGFCKMTDMGLAKQCVGKTYTSCGTPDYFAPEIIAHIGYTESVDWWTVGVLTHEFMSGQAPFQAANPQQTYAKVRRGISCVSFPYEQNYPEAVEFVKSMLNRDPSQRLASLPGGIVNCKRHPFYTAFDFSWQKFLKNQIPVPYKPLVNGPRDLSNFKQREDVTPKKFDLEYVDPKNGWDDSW